MAIISTNQVGSAYHIIENEKNGYMIEAGNVVELANTMQNYINNQMLIQLHSSYSFKLSKNFSAKANVERFIQSINKWENSTQL